MFIPFPDGGVLFLTTILEALRIYLGRKSRFMGYLRILSAFSVITNNLIFFPGRYIEQTWLAGHIICYPNNTVRIVHGLFNIFPK